MHHHYNDITFRIPEPPKWYDEHAVPRYCNFAPGEVADIYADDVALVEIACQNCGERFLVAFSEGGMQRAFHPHRPTLRDDIRNGSLHYGDPPNNGCCPSGATMNCEDIRVVEFWHRDRFDWERVAEFEVLLADHPGFRPRGALPPASEHSSEA